MSKTDLIALHDDNDDGNNSKNKETEIGQQPCEFCMDYVFIF
jgi:hypothetical protein